MERTTFEFKWTTKTVIEINWDTAQLQIAQLMQRNATIDWLAAWIFRNFRAVVEFFVAQTFVARGASRVN